MCVKSEPCTHVHLISMMQLERGQLRCNRRTVCSQLSGARDRRHRQPPNNMSTMMDCSLASRMASKRLRRHRLNRDATGELFLRPPSKIRGFVQAQAAPGPFKVLAPCINQERSESVDKVATKRKASHELFLAPDGTKRTPQEIDAAFARLVSNAGLVAETANRLLAMYNEDEDMRRRYSLLICMDYYLMPCRRAYYMGFCDGPAVTGQCYTSHVSYM